jgi:hypothetical protein
VGFTLDGYQICSFPAVRIHEDSTTVLHHLFARMTHPLTIRSDPAGAAIYLDNEHVGATPCILEAVAAGEYELEVRRDGYASGRQRLSVPAADNLVEIALTELPPGELVFQVEPYADFWIDGVLHTEGDTHYRITLAQGTYAIELRHPHYPTERRTVEVRSGETVTLQHRFGTDEEGQ